MLRFSRLLPRASAKSMLTTKAFHARVPSQQLTVPSEYWNENDVKSFFPPWVAKNTHFCIYLCENARGFHGDTFVLALLFCSLKKNISDSPSIILIHPLFRQRIGTRKVAEALEVLQNCSFQKMVKKKERAREGERDGELNTIFNCFLDRDDLFFVSGWGLFHRKKKRERF